MTMFGLLPPHSSDTRFRFDCAAYWATSLPVAVEPVKAIASTSMCEAQRFAGRVAEAGHDAEDAGRDPRLQREFGEPQCGQRRLLRGLEHERVAGGERRPDLPGRHDHREIPGHDGPDHADRLATDQRERVLRGRRDFAVDLVDGLGVPADAARGGGNVHLQRIADRLAHVQRLEQRQFRGGGLDEPCEFLQHPLARGRRLARPVAALECASRRRDRRVDVGGAACGNERELTAVDRAQAGESRAIARAHALAVDHGFAPRLQRARALVPIDAFVAALIHRLRRSSSRARRLPRCRSNPCRS